jgi:hypothetical protein
MEIGQNYARDIRNAFVIFRGKVIAKRVMIIQPPYFIPEKSGLQCVHPGIYAPSRGIRA